MVVTVTLRVASVEEIICVTIWLVSVQMDVNHIGLGPDVTVSI